MFSVNQSSSDKAKYTPEGLFCQSVPADGHSLFHAIGLSLGKDASFLRSVVATQMEQNKEKFSDFRRGTDNNFDQYIKDIREEREWGDHIEIKIIQQVINRPIIILQPNNNPIIPDNLYSYSTSHDDPIFLLYNGVHYDALLVKKTFQANKVLDDIILKLKQDQQVSFDQTRFTEGSTKTSHIDDLSQQISGMSIDSKSDDYQNSSQSKSAIVRRIKQAHLDDIHGITVFDNCIITGSKDTVVKMWRKNGDFIKIVEKPPNNTYTTWVTALSGFSNTSVVVGFRNGYLLCKNAYKDYRYYGGILYKTIQGRAESSGASYYKQRNKQRIMGILCQKKAADQGYKALVGLPEEFVQFDFKSKTVTKSYKFKNPEWVYGFAELDQNKIAAIHGCSLSLFKECEPTSDSTGFKHITQLISENKTCKSAQRPYISDVKKFQNQSSWLALSFFGGRTRVIDAENSAKTIHQGSEHKERVWQAIPTNDFEYISCADDGLIKIWDVRAQQSMRTFSGHPGRVSALGLLPDKNMFVAGTCAPKPDSDPDKGQLLFYDIRF